MKNNSKYLLTGATGFLGSHIMAALLRKGKTVAVAGRPRGGKTLKERIQRLLVWFGIECLEGSMEYHETDFSQLRLGLGRREYGNLCNSTGCVVHFASDTGFAEKNREKIMASNVQNLDEILNFAGDSGAGFHFVSTAYAWGIGSDQCREAPVRSSRFTNVYEESKAIAERVVFERCAASGIPFTIMRPSIVIGDSVTGKSLGFKALYYPVRSLLYIRDIYLSDHKNNGGRNSRKYDIYFNGKGELHLPVRIFLPNDGKINLIPVNYFTDATVAIVENPGTGTFYHITNNNPESFTKLVSYAERFLGITGTEVVIGSSPGEMRNPAEELFDHFIGLYRPYLSDKRTFARENTDSMTGGLFPPEIDYENFERCMSYAVEVDWGRNLFPSGE